MHRSAVRPIVLVAVVVPALLSLLALPPVREASAQDAPSGDGRFTRKAVSGDGRGLATFGDRGLTSFGDRFDEGFGRRGFESFSDIPLAPMGGLEVPGPSARRSGSGDDTSAHSRQRSRRSRRLFDQFPSAPTSQGGGWASAQERGTSRGTSRSTRGFGPDRSVASLHGIVLPPVREVALPVLLPPLRLPALTLDHRPALEALQGSLRAELQGARRRGDADVARLLAAALGD